jgi:SAM-dependent methyltransferase
VRYGQLYSAAVLRPLAEQVAALCEVHDDDVVCDLLYDSGELSRALATRIQAGTVYAVDTALEVEDVRQQTRGTPSGVQLLVMDGCRVPLDDRSCDCVASLFTLGFSPAAVGEANRILRPAGRYLVATWDPDAPPAHEALLARALSQHGRSSDYLQKVLWVPARFKDCIRLHDVVRFDGFTHYWAAMVTARPFATDVAAMDEALLRRVRETVRAELERFAAADGTYRLPVDALLTTM